MPGRLSAHEEAKRLAELRERDERELARMDREDREREKSSWRDEAADAIARAGL